MIKILSVILLCLVLLGTGCASAEEKLTLQDGAGQDISAVIFLPEGQEPPYRTVICSHGFGGTMDYGSKAYARFFAQNGFEKHMTAIRSSSEDFGRWACVGRILLTNSQNLS